MTAKQQEVIKVSLGQFLDLQVFRNSPNYRYLHPIQITARLTAILGPELVDRMNKIYAAGKTVVWDVKEVFDHTDEELAELGYEGLKILGFTPEQARNRIAARMTEETLNVYRRWNQTEKGQRIMAAQAENWKKKGVAPPWEGQL